MEVIKITKDLIFNENTVIGLGNFDGVHLGHQKLIKKVIDDSKRLNCKSAVLTFSNCIDKVLNKDCYGEISPLDEKLEILKSLGLDYVFLIDFNKEIMGIDPIEFLNKYLNKLNIKEAVIGDDYRFGYKGQGNADLLKQFFNVKIVDYSLNYDGNKISSTKIISYIKEGNVELAYKNLGRDYAIKGKVIKGLGNGKKLGFPTANIDYNDFVLPMDGVYGVNIEVDNRIYKGLAYIGNHPSIDKINNKNLEVFIFDFSNDIYNKKVSVFFKKFIRKEMVFDDLENLKKQVNLDTFSNF